MNRSLISKDPTTGRYKVEEDDRSRSVGLSDLEGREA